MKAIVLNNVTYCVYPEDYDTLKKFVKFLNMNYNSFIRVTKWSEKNCIAPYFIEGEKEEIFLNVASIRSVHEETITVLSKEAYDCRLDNIIKMKCVHCINYNDNLCSDNLTAYKENINLDGECYSFERKSD